MTARFTRWLRPTVRQLRAWRWRIVESLHRHQLPWRLSREQALFDNYKRARARMCPEDLSRLRVPAEADLISIVLPVYNGERYLREAVDSVLAQTWGRFELIVVDDGSTDGTAGILAEYQQRDARIMVIAQANQKLPRALSTGFREARGEYLTWISADNRLRPEFLRRMVECLKRHPAWDMIYANEDIIGEDGLPADAPDWYPLHHRPLNSHHMHFPTDVSELNIAGVNYVGAAFMYRARVWWLIGDYAPSRFGIEDYDYWLRVNALLTLRHADFDEPLYEYRLHKESLTSQAAELGVQSALRRLMGLDEHRRSFYLKPCTWWIDADASDGDCRLVASELGRRVASAGQNDLANSQGHPGGASRLLHVRIIDAANPCPAPAPDSPRFLRVLLVVAKKAVPEQAPHGWDICMAWSPSAEFSQLRDRRGWLAVDDVTTLYTAIDVRARSHYLAIMDADVEAGRAEAAGPARNEDLLLNGRIRQSPRPWRVPHCMRR